MLKNRILISVALEFFLLGLSPGASFASNPTDGVNSSSAADATFSKAVASYKAGKLEDARTGLLDLESRYPTDPSLLLNLGLIAQKEKRLGAAMAIWRKGLVANPTDESLSNAIDWLKPKLPKSEIAHEIEAWEEFRKSFLIRVSPIAVTAVSAIFLLFAGWFLLRWWGSRRRALELETSLPPTPIAGLAFSFLFLIMAGLSIAIIFDRLELRGTIINAKAEVRSAPDAAATALFEVYEGMEVVVRDSRTVGDLTWRRITYPGGMTGWVQDGELLTSVDASERAWGPGK